jgi:hypothetical protein
MSTIPADCVARISSALGEKVPRSRVDEVAKEIDRLQREVVREGGSPADSLRQATQRYANQLQLAAIIEQRNSAINARLFAERLQYVRTAWKGREAEGLRALLTGSVEGRRGARASAAREQSALMGQYFGQVTTELERAGLLGAFKTGALDDDVARALWQLNEREPRLDGIPADAVTIARAVHKAQEVARADANRAGAWIGKLSGWITRQSHDPWKLVKRGSQAWADAIAPRLDWARMESQHGPIKDRAKWLAETYTNLAGGMHLKAPGAENNTGFKGPGNLAKRMSQDRVLHFKSADDWLAYNREFGTGNLRESVFRGLKSSAENTGLMRVFGPNPEAMYTRLVDQLRRDVRESANVKAMKEFDKATAEDGWLSRRVNEVTGKANIAVDELWARRGSNIRAWQSMAKLGGAVISSITDLATYGAEMHYQGRGFLSGIGEAIGGLVQGRAKGEQREILSSLGVFFDSLSSDITRTGSLDETMGGRTSRLLQSYFNWNLLNWWTDSLRGSAALSMSHHLALQVGRKSFDDLGPELAP